MSKRLAPYGNENYIGSVAAVGVPGKVKGARRLAERAPSSAVLAKVGGGGDPVVTDGLRLVRLKAR